MAEEMAFVGHRQRLRLAALAQRKRHGEKPRLTAEHHGALASGIDGKAVAARGHRHHQVVVPSLVQQHGFVTPTALARA
ncbi:hypothetical protein D3C73_898600 [compost metagenome]